MNQQQIPTSADHAEVAESGAGGGGLGGLGTSSSSGPAASSSAEVTLHHVGDHAEVAVARGRVTASTQTSFPVMLSMASSPLSDCVVEHEVSRYFFLPSTSRRNDRRRLII